MPLAQALHEPRTDRERIAVAVVAEVARATGLDPHGAAVFRSATSILVGLPAARVLGRLDDPARPDSAQRQVIVARALATSDVPAVRLADGIDQPVPTAVGDITFWRYEGVESRAPGAASVARLARTLHDAFRSPRPGLPVLDPLVAIDDQLRRAEAGGDTEPGHLALLGDHVARLRPRWETTIEDDPAGTTLVHGDLHRHNVLLTASGPVLADLELAGTGPASYDLVPALVAVDRYGAPADDYDRFASAYGFDVRTWDGCAVLTEVYELWVTAWAVANRATSERHDEEAERRLARWLDPDHPQPVPWSLL
jgi:hypothetical protein